MPVAACFALSLALLTRALCHVAGGVWPLPLPLTGHCPSAAGAHEPQPADAAAPVDLAAVFTGATVAVVVIGFGRAGGRRMVVAASVDALGVLVPAAIAISVLVPAVRGGGHAAASQQKTDKK